ncbi:MAG: diguanylate cyclase [bacterium]|nr:diguanylate cyclase [bacterium]
MEPRQLLVVDDDPTVCQIMSMMLTEQLGYDVVTETDARKVLALLREGDFDIVLLDIVMPDLDGLEVIDQIRQHFNVLPILVVTAYGSAEITVDAMRRGATDFITKPVDAPLLDLRIRSAFALEQTRRMANTDGLTGLYNHRYMQERLEQEIERAERYERPLSVVMADLDHFKSFNDTFGHPRGDEALIQVSHTLRQVSRASDIVARYGGEEFTLVLPETTVEEARVVAERARQCVAALDLGRPPHVPRVTLSLGVASHTVGDSKKALIEAADVALFEAKRGGRDRVCVTEGGDNEDRDTEAERVLEASVDLSVS